MIAALLSMCVHKHDIAYVHEVPSYCSEQSNDHFTSTVLQHELNFSSTLTLPPSYTCTGAGVPHIVEQILLSLDVKSLVMSEQVSSVWRDIFEYLRIWKRLIKHKIDSNPLWRALFKRRGWLVRRRVGILMYHTTSTLVYLLFHNNNQADTFCVKHPRLCLVVGQVQL